MGRKKLYGEDSAIFTFRGPGNLDKALKIVAAKMGITHSRLIYEILAADPRVIKEVKTLDNEHTRKSRKHTVQPGRRA